MNRFYSTDKKTPLLLKRRWKVLALSLILAGLMHSISIRASETTQTWSTVLLEACEKARALPSNDERSQQISNICKTLKEQFPMEWDWALQDSDGQIGQWIGEPVANKWPERLLTRSLSDLGEQRKLEDLKNASSNLKKTLDLYVSTCKTRRHLRLKNLSTKAPQLVFTKRRTIHPSFFAYTEGQSDAQNEWHFAPDSALCLWTASSGKCRTLLSDSNGVLRDPCVTWDGQRVLFAWKKSLREDDYHLYELTLATGKIRQLTSGLGFADYEPACLPNGHIIFSSTRCVQTVDCWWTEVSNLYTCDENGNRWRRLTFDQVHSICPQILDDGRIIYTRWDYNDRTQLWTQALFQMNADGTGQTVFYKNNSWFPTTIAHARGIPGTEKIMCVFTGHHTPQTGKLGILDPLKGREENSGAQLIAPPRPTTAVREDVYGQEGELFQYPVPLNENEFLVTYAPSGWQKTEEAKGGADFGIYWMNQDGQRELLISDARLACQQAVPVVARQKTSMRFSTVNLQKTSGTYYMQDVYAGLSLKGIPRGIVKKLRVVALSFRSAGVGNNGCTGPAGEALVSTPISVGNGSWDVKTVLGDATVYEDGSAFFTVPARVPVYFQALDSRNQVVQTMRSWSTLQPGENQACIGCHESKNSVPHPYGTPEALKKGVQSLSPFYGPARGFSFSKEIQPILDRHCIRCHQDRSLKPDIKKLEKAPTRQQDPEWTVLPPLLGWPETNDVTRKVSTETKANLTFTNKPAFSLSGMTTLDDVAKRYWSDAYLNLTLSTPTDYYESVGAFLGVFDSQMVNWIGSQSVPTLLPPYVAGSAQSKLFLMLSQGHYGVELSGEELDKLSCWIDLYVPYCGDYEEANAWSPEEMEKYTHFAAKRKRMEELEQKNIEDIIADQKSHSIDK